MTRKDDPVFNVKFVQLVENQACLWNYTHPGYSKKEEVQKAWQHVANEIRDTVRNSRERWRTIRSSFLRSLKLARTQTGRGKRKYYLSKYLQFLIPYTKSRGCHKQQQQQQLPTSASASSHAQTSNANGGMVLRKPSTATAATAATATFVPMTRIGHMRPMGHQHRNVDEDETKDSNGSVGAAAAESTQEEEQDEEQQQQHQQQQQQHAALPLPLPLRLQPIKVEQQQQHIQSNDKFVAAAAQHSLTMAAALRNNMDWTELTEWLKVSSGGSSSNNNNNQLQQLHNSNSGNNNNNSNHNHINMLAHHVGATLTPPPATGTPAPATVAAVGIQQAAAAAAATAATTVAPPDADYSFLISLHPYLKEMSGKQNRRFRQKVVGLIDTVLDNLDI